MKPSTTAEDGRKRTRGRAFPLICVLAGQSDMVGRGEPNKLADDLVEAGSANRNGHQVFLLYEIDRLSKEGAPSDSGGEFRALGRTTQYSNAGQCYSFGPEWGIADRLLQTKEFRENNDDGDASDADGEIRKDIYFIKFAAGSTNLHEDWPPGGELFSGMVELVKAGARQIAANLLDDDNYDTELTLEDMQKHLIRDHTVFFWLQGHSDAAGKAIMRTSYEENFLRFVPAVRQALLNGNEESEDDNVEDPGTSGLNLPFIASELDWLLDENSKSSVRFARRLKDINLALSNACTKLSESEEDPLPCVFAEFPGKEADWFRLSYHPDGHCDNGGLLSLGRNMARCYSSRFAGA